MVELLPDMGGRIEPLNLILESLEPVVILFTQKIIGNNKYYAYSIYQIKVNV